MIIKSNKEDKVVAMRSTLSKMPAIVDIKINEMDEEFEDEDEVLKKQNSMI